jgi:hypothetical protein
VIRKSGWKNFSAIPKTATTIKIDCFIAGAEIHDLMMNDDVWEELAKLATPPPESPAKSDKAKKKASDKDTSSRNAEFGEKLNRILRSWRIIYKMLPTASVNELDILEPLLDEFGESYIDLFGDLVTPYIHIVVCHTAQLIRKYGPLGRYEQQGLENSINIHKRSFFRASNRFGGKKTTPVSTLMQIFNRFYRLRYFGQKYCRFLFKRKVTAPRQPKATSNAEPEVPQVSLESLTQEQFDAAVQAQYELEESLIEESVSGAGSSEGTLISL